MSQYITLILTLGSRYAFICSAARPHKTAENKIRLIMYVGVKLYMYCFSQDTTLRTPIFSPCPPHISALRTRYTYLFLSELNDPGGRMYVVGVLCSIIQFSALSCTTSVHGENHPHQLYSQPCTHLLPIFLYKNETLISLHTGSTFLLSAQ